MSRVSRRLVVAGIGLLVLFVLWGFALELRRRMQAESDEANRRRALTGLTPRGGHVYGYSTRNIGAYLGILNGNPSVHCFGLEDCTFGPAGSHDLLLIPNLREVMLCGMEVSEAELQPILEHPAVRGFALVNCRLPPAALTKIAGHPHLERLVIARPSISSAPPTDFDRFLEQLAASPSLEGLWLSSPPFSAGSIQRLRDQRPDLQVHVVGENFWCGEASNAIRLEPVVR